LAPGCSWRLFHVTPFCLQRKYLLAGWQKPLDGCPGLMVNYEEHICKRL
jgi:hypothetical protein